MAETTEPPNQLTDHRAEIVRHLNDVAEEGGETVRELMLLSALVRCHRGVVTFGTTEPNGAIGLWAFDSPADVDRRADAAGDTATDVLADALLTLDLQDGEVRWTT